MALTQNSGELIKREAVRKYQSEESEGQRGSHQQGKEQRSRPLTVSQQWKLVKTRERSACTPVRLSPSTSILSQGSLQLVSSKPHQARRAWGMKNLPCLYPSWWNCAVLFSGERETLKKLGHFWPCALVNVNQVLTYNGFFQFRKSSYSFFCQNV